MTPIEAKLTSLCPDAIVRHSVTGLDFYLVSDISYNRDGYVGVYNKEHDKHVVYPIDELTPYFYRLEDMTEEDRKEFSKIFVWGRCSNFRVVDSVVKFDLAVDGESGMIEGVMCNVEQLIWLMSHGYYCGQVEKWEVRAR